MAKTKNAMKMVDSMVGGNKRLKKAIEEATVNARVAQLIYDVRTKAGLTQKQLAQRIGTKQSVIARLEDADYEGHSLFMLQRIAAVLDRRLVIDLLPKKRAA